MTFKDKHKVSGFKFYKGTLAILAVFLFISSFFISESYGADGKLTLYFLSDIQSQLLPLTSKVNKISVSTGGLAHAAGIVAAEKKNNPDSIFFHTGEAVLGIQWRKLAGEPEFKALNEAGVQVGMFGRHEFDYGFQHMKRGLSYATFPIVVSNVTITDPELDEIVKENLILPSGDMKVGFFSLVSPGLYATTKIVEEIKISADLTAVARNMVASLKEQGADVIIMMSYLTEKENLEVAKNVSGIHVIVGLDRLAKNPAEPVFVNSPDEWITALIVNDDRGKFVGKFTLETSKGKLVCDKFVWEMLPVTPKAQANMNVMKIATEAEETLYASMENVIGHFKNAVDARSSFLRTGEAPLGNFVADSMRWFLRTDAALINSGSIRSNTVYPASPVTDKMLTALIPYDDMLYIVSVTGKQLRQAMEISASALVGDEVYDPSCRTPSGGFLQVSGLRVVYSLAGKPVTFDKDGNLTEWGNRVKSLKVFREGAWHEVEDDVTYTLALNRWIAGGGDRFFIFKDIPNQVTSFKDLTVITDFFQTFQDSKALLERDGRITIEK